ncbi:MAG: ribonuclease G [Pseudomonadales bacterium]|nr:ribonuclease G [Pseudomonadales bacterium]
MSDEILVNATPMETRVAIINNGMLQEVFIERTQSRGIVGNIYNGKVVRVLPGMQAAFVDIGLERACFLHVKDLQNAEDKDIRELLREGQKITVQVNKDPISTKGARVSALLSVSSRYLVYMPDLDKLGISQRIDDDEERTRLKSILAEMLEAEDKDDSAQKLGGNYIIRTAAEGAGRDELVKDMAFLKRLWAVLESDIKTKKMPSCVYQDLAISERVLRDLMLADFEKIRVDSRETIQRMQDFCDEFVPDVKPLLEWYPGGRPILELYGVEDELQRALSRKVDLKSGGHLIFDQTEAMTTIDVNTGGYVGHRNLEETIFKTNLEAATSLARQLRVRNLGGIIIIDFIDMLDAEHRRQVLRTLEKGLAKDHTRTALTGVTELGLVQVVRKRTRESLEQMLCEPCQTCNGRGTIKSAETVCYEIFRAILREARAYEHDAYLVLASQTVVDRLLDEESANVADLEDFMGKPVQFQVESAYTQEQFDVILL